jgi:hypothetical protein|nr:MAG TPA: hypothetical protein [Caudoviricetes sp.]DAI42101.1 MAG TPA: hypothetical protein [Caudoviricetes sp.]DAN81249.1 MAG TPA: hypothetical protein [Caudoviricetes sp.]
MEKKIIDKETQKKIEDKLSSSNVKIVDNKIKLTD